MNGSYTLQEASFTDVANNYSTYKAVGGHSGPPPPPGMPINNDPKLNLETSTGWPNKEFSSHNFNFSQFTLEMSGGIAAQTDFTHPELVTLETVATVNQGAAGTINYTPSEDLEIASFEIFSIGLPDSPPFSNLFLFFKFSLFLSVVLETIIIPISCSIMILDTSLI